MGVTGPGRAPGKFGGVHLVVNGTAEGPVDSLPWSINQIVQSRRPVLYCGLSKAAPCPWALSRGGDGEGGFALGSRGASHLDRPSPSWPGLLPCLRAFVPAVPSVQRVVLLDLCRATFGQPELSAVTHGLTIPHLEWELCRKGGRVCQRLVSCTQIQPPTCAS